MKLKKTGHRLILFIDEFDKVARDRRFERGFFDNLRSIAMHFPLGFVVASVMPLAEVAYEGVSSSPFFNFFQEERLEQLSTLEVEALIAHPPCGERGVGDYAEQITLLAGNHPFFLQLACICAWEIREEFNDNTDSIILIRSFTKKARNQYRYIWQHCTSVEQKVLCNLAHGPQFNGYELEMLVEKGYVLDSEPMRICGEGLANFVKAQCPPTKEKYTDEIVKPVVQLKNKSNSFDVFLCYHHKDKHAVKKLADELLKQDIRPWFDEWELRSGKPWQPLIEEQVASIEAAAVFVGEQGFGPWQEQEINAFLRELVKRECPVIPVLLSNALEEPQLPLFLQGITWVDFRKQEPDPMVQLIWGIKGRSWKED
jgi:hypothetical protein